MASKEFLNKEKCLLLCALCVLMIISRHVYSIFCCENHR